SRCEIGKLLPQMLPAAAGGPPADHAAGRRCSARSGAAIAASRVAPYPYVGVGLHGAGKSASTSTVILRARRWRGRCVLQTAPLASTSKSSSLQCPDERLADARLRISTSGPASIIAIVLCPPGFALHVSTGKVEMSSRRGQVPYIRSVPVAPISRSIFSNE